MGRKQRHSSSSPPSGSHDSKTIIMATKLAQELKPEHKLPNEKILVRPKSAFLELLATAGAIGTVFTSQEILQFLIKYIEDLHLYDPNDPRMVYCEKDQLGVVFGVKMFTIKDARKLIFANVDIVSGQREKDKASVVQPEGGFQQKDKHYYYTLQHSHWLTSGSASGSNVEPSAVATAADECDAPIKIVPSKSHTMGKRTRSDSLDSKSSKKRSVHSVSVSEDEKEIVVPWYAKKYSRDDVTSVSTDQHSVQDKLTAVVANSSDDLWFLEEDQLEFEIESDTSSESYRSVSSVDSALTEAIFEVEVQENVSIFGDVDSDTDSIDTEISERDKWECNECNTTNPPIHGYCMGCWALRKGWLADEKRLTLMERLMSQRRSLSRSLSAPSDMRLPHESIRSSMLVSDDNCDGLGKSPSSSDDEKAKTDVVDEQGDDEAGIGTRPKSPISSSDTVLLDDPEERVTSTVRVLKGKQSRFSRRSTSVASASTSRLEPGSSEFFSVGRHAPSDEGGIGKTSVCPVDTEEAPPAKKTVSPNDLCMLCESRTKNASIIHGRSGHQVCCYSCAKKLRRHGKPCPVCRKKIQHVIKNYLL